MPRNRRMSGFKDAITNGLADLLNNSKKVDDEKVEGRVEEIPDPSNDDFWNKILEGQKPHPSPRSTFKAKTVRSRTSERTLSRERTSSVFSGISSPSDSINHLYEEYYRMIKNPYKVKKTSFSDIYEENNEEEPKQINYALEEMSLSGKKLVEDPKGLMCEQTKRKFNKKYLCASHKNVSFDKKNKRFKSDVCYVLFPDFEVTVRDSEGNRINVASREEALKSGFIESLKDGIFYVDEDARKRYEKQKRPISFSKLGTKGNGIYGIPYNKTELIKFGTVSPTDIITQGKGYTFGVEIETCKGYVPTYLYKDLNMESVKDGSILDSDGRKSFSDGDYIGREYVTGVLRGDAGFKQLEKICNVLAKRCSVNRTCGVHVHVGNLDFTKEVIVMVYKLATAIEKDIFSLLPPSRRGNDYCSDLKKFKFPLEKIQSKEEFRIKIDEYYNTLFRHLAGQDPSRSCNKETNHPRGRTAGYDKRHPRYDWLNFMPAMFNLRDVRESDKNGKSKIVSYTLELRNHSGSTNYTRIRNWVLITMAMVYCAENCQDAIINNKIKTVDDMLKLAYKGNRLTRMLRYTKERREKFNGESASNEEHKDYEKVSPEDVKDVSMKELVN